MRTIVRLFGAMCLLGALAVSAQAQHQQQQRVFPQQRVQPNYGVPQQRMVVPQQHFQPRFVPQQHFQPRFVPQQRFVQPHIQQHFGRHFGGPGDNRQMWINGQSYYYWQLNCFDSNGNILYQGPCEDSIPAEGDDIVGEEDGGEGME